jgi:hypothetical protein
MSLLVLQLFSNSTGEEHCNHPIVLKIIRSICNYVNIQPRLSTENISRSPVRCNIPSPSEVNYLSSFITVCDSSTQVSRSTLNDRVSMKVVIPDPYSNEKRHYPNKNSDLLFLSQPVRMIDTSIQIFHNQPLVLMTADRIREEEPLPNIAETFLAYLTLTKLAKNPLFGAISLHGRAGPLLYQFTLEGSYLVG